MMKQHETAFSQTKNQQVPQQQSPSIDEWSQYQVKSPINVSEQQTNAPQDEWSQYAVKPQTNLGEFNEQQETYPKSIPRWAAQYGSRYLEGIAGVPGDLRSLTQNLIGKGAEKLGLTSPEQAKKLRELEESSISQNLTSSGLQELSERATGGYTSPKTSTEKEIGEAVKDLGSLSWPIKGRIPFFRALGASVAGHGSKEVAKQFGANEKQQEYTKMGAMFLTNLVNPKENSKAYYNRLYNEAETLLPKNTYVNAGPLSKNLHEIEKDLLKGVSTPSKNPVLQSIKELKQKIVRGRIDAEDLIEAKKNINELRGNPAILQKGRVKYNDIARSIDNSLERYGQEHNKEFLIKYRNANESYGTIKNTQNFSRFMKTNIEQNMHKLPFKEQFAKAVPYVFLYGAQSLGGGVPLIGTAASVGVYKAIQLAQRYTRSPALRNHYNAVVREALKENSPAVFNHLKRMEKLDEETKD